MISYQHNLHKRFIKLEVDSLSLFGIKISYAILKLRIMKVLIVLSAVFMLSLNLIAQENELQNQEKYNEIALSPAIINAQQTEMNDLLTIITSLDRIISENGKLAEKTISPYMLYLKYSFEKINIIEKKTQTSIVVLLDFYVIDNISKQQTASNSMKIVSKQSDETSALIVAIKSVSIENEDLQNMIRSGREEIYSRNVLQCLEFMNMVQIKIHEGQQLKAIGALLHLSEFEGECVMMSDQLLIEAVNSKNMMEASRNLESLEYYVERKLDLSDVRRYADLLANDVQGKEFLVSFIKDYGLEDEYLEVLIEANEVYPEPISDEKSRVQAKELILVQEEEKILNIRMLQETEMWVNELKP
jgi:hypothetical protein